MSWTHVAFESVNRSVWQHDLLLLIHSNSWSEVEVEVETEVVGDVEGTNMRHYINDAEYPGVE